MEEGKFFGMEEQHFDRAAEVVRGLYELPRAGWVVRGVEKDVESVGQHNDALIEMAKKFFKEKELTKDEDVVLDQKKLERMLQIHDWPELITGDEIVVCKDPEERKRLKAEKRTKELEAMNSICANLGEEGKEIFGLWEEYEAKKTPEAQIAGQLDKLQAMYRAWEYQKNGEEGVSAQEFIDYARKDVYHPILVKWLEELEREVKNKTN